MKRFTLGRLFRIHQKIRSGIFPSVAELARDEEVSERTIKRDIQFLKDSLGAPVSYSKHERGYYYTKKWEFPFPKLSAGEILSLFIATHLLKNFKDTPLSSSIESLMKKIERVAPEESILTSKEVEMLLSVSFQPIKTKREISEVFEVIFNGIRERRTLKIKYYTISRDEITERKVNPYHLYNFEGVWYFVGFCQLRGELRDFALDRILEIKTLKERFNIPKDFNPKDYLEKAWRIYKGGEKEIVLKFDKYESRWIKERIWHKTQKIEELDDGGILFKVTANPEEIKRWIIGYASHIEVLKPESLKKEIEDEIKKLSKIYKINEKKDIS